MRQKIVNENALRVDSVDQEKIDAEYKSLKDQHDAMIAQIKESQNYGTPAPVPSVGD